MIEYVWYAAYGSNLYRNRFYLYLQGGNAEYVNKTYSGCSNKSLPAKEGIYSIPYELYFSQKTEIWENKAVTFVKSMPDYRKKTLCKIYLITKEQFLEINQQENSERVDFKTSNIDLDTTRLQRFSLAGNENNYQWYGRIIYLGEREGFPIYTFTAKWDDNDIDYSAPCNNYLTIIIKGLKDSLGLNDKQIYEYLNGKAGIKHNFSEQILRDLIRNTKTPPEESNELMVN